MEEVDFLPQPPEDPRLPDKDLCRLWIGNLDPKLTEYTLLKIVQQISVTLRHFDFLYHKAGPDKGKPRGYCFITVSKPDEAVRVVDCLNGKKVGSRKLVVRLATVDNKTDEPQKNSLAVKDSTDVTVQDATKISQIKAIEAKLRLMEENSDVSAFQGVSVSNLTPVIRSNSTGNLHSSWSKNESRYRSDSNRSRGSAARRSHMPYHRNRNR